MIPCPQEIAWPMGFIDDAPLERLGEEMESNGYGK